MFCLTHAGHSDGPLHPLAIMASWQCMIILAVHDPIFNQDVCYCYLFIPIDQHQGVCGSEVRGMWHRCSPVKSTSGSCTASVGGRDKPSRFKLIQIVCLPTFETTTVI